MVYHSADARDRSHLTRRTITKIVHDHEINVASALDEVTAGEGADYCDRFYGAAT
jgi:hypothetical protein